MIIIRKDKGKESPYAPRKCFHLQNYTNFSKTKKHLFFFIAIRHSSGATRLIVAGASTLWPMVSRHRPARHTHHGATRSYLSHTHAGLS